MTTSRPSRRSSPTTSIVASKRSSRSTRPTRRSSATRSTSTSSPTRFATHYTEHLRAYRETPNKPHEGIAIWVSGFFGSGKSSFAKMLGLSIENRIVAGEPAAERFAQRAGDKKLQVLLKAINEKIPTHAVIFDVSTDRGIRSGNQTLTEIMYGLFLQSLGYAKDLDFSELEIALEAERRLREFEDDLPNTIRKRLERRQGAPGVFAGSSERGDAIR